MRCALSALLLCSWLRSTSSQSLEYVYWTPIVGQPQSDSSQALRALNGSDATVFKPTSGPGPVPTMFYQSGACWLCARVARAAGAHCASCLAHPLSSRALPPHLPPPLFPAGTQYILSTTFTSSVALPSGAAQADVPADVSGMPYSSYAFGGSVTSSTGVVSYSSSWLGWTGRAWVPITTAGAAPAPRVNAGAVFLKACDAGGNPCIVLLGGLTPGTPMAASGLGVMILSALTSATPAFAPLTTSKGAAAAIPTGRHSMAVSASPDGTTAFMFGGALDGGAVTSDFWALSMPGWSNDNNAVTAELQQVISYNGIAANALEGTPAFPPTTVKQYPCNPVIGGARCLGGSTDGYRCWSTANRHYGKGAGTADWYRPPLINQCDSWGSNNQLGSAWNAIDGNTNGDFSLGSVTRSNSDNSLFNWPPATTWKQGDPPVQLRVDLQQPMANIQQVHLYWRTDCCLSRSGGFQVYIGNNAGPDLSTNTLVPNPYSDAVLNPTILPTSDYSGRYVFVALPGVLRVLGVAEIMVYVRKPKTWRKLNGLTNVASGAAVVQTSAQPTTLSTLVGDPAYAVDGLTSTVSQTNSGIFLGNPLAGRQYLMVDLGAEYNILSIGYLSGSQSTGGGNVGLNTMVSLGVTQDLQQATPCTSTPGLNTGTGAFIGAAPVTIATCKGSARYVHIWKTASAAAGAAGGQQNTISVRELVINAEVMRYLPEARRGAGYAVYGKYLVIQGGYRADYTACADLRFFDMTTFSWLPTPLSGLLGNPPPPAPTPPSSPCPPPTLPPTQL